MHRKHDNCGLFNRDLLIMIEWCQLCPSRVLTRQRGSKVFQMMVFKCSSPKNHHQIAPDTDGNHHQQNCAPLRTYFFTKIVHLLEIIFKQNCAPLRNYQTKRSPTLPERWWGIALWVPTYSNFPLREFLFFPINNSRIFFRGECFIKADGNGFAS